MPSSTIRTRHASAAAIVVLALAAITACSENDASNNDPSTTTTTTTVNLASLDDLDDQETLVAFATSVTGHRASVDEASCASATEVRRERAKG